MPFQSNPNKHPGYDPVAVSEMIKKDKAGKARLLRLIKMYRHENKKGAVLVLKEIKKVLSSL
jgi:hypothetical protein